jgi:ADP-ribose pyrophosphatase YjhB (NUDIX family)
MGKSRRLSSPALTQPQTPPTTATTVTAWLTDSDGHVLILRKADEAVFSEPSGNVDGVETLEQALVRGVGLQTGLDLPSISNTDGHTRVQQQRYDTRVASYHLPTPDDNTCPEATSCLRN